MNPDLELALELCEVADAITFPRFRAHDLRVETKPDLTPVSEADRAVEEALSAHLRRARPADSLVGEEFGVAGTTGARRRWIIDPIDGTKNYVRGVPAFATLLALEEDGEVVVGVASAPALHRRWWAARGEGAFADGDAIHVSAISRMEDAQLFHTGFDRWNDDDRDAFLGLAGRCWRTRGFGDFWSHVLVAEGCGEVALEAPGVSLWDLAAPKIIVEEAGGRFTDYSGTSTASGGSAIATNGLLHGEVLAAFANHPPGGQA
ncbi:MAG: inositol monophosphatase family protein [Candidatus Dormibacteria bacterium]